jgi:hypothetical protein
MGNKKNSKPIKHKHSATANTDGVFKTFIGCKVTGYLEHRGDDVLIFECGWGLVFHENGSCWTTEPEEVSDWINEIKEKIAIAG